MKIAVVMGSISDMPVMQEAIDIIKEFGGEDMLKYDLQIRKTFERLTELNEVK